MRSLSYSCLDQLTKQAVGSVRLRQHLNLHQNYEEPCQRLLNAIEPNSYIRPHSHGIEQGPETLFAIRGLMALILFSHDGKIQRVLRFGAGVHSLDPSVLAGVEILPGEWHTVISLEHASILLEMKGGPFNPVAPKYPAFWAPEEDSDQALNYFVSLVKLALT